MKITLFVASVLIASSVFAQKAPKVYGDEAAAPATTGEKEIAGLFDRWNAALATGKPAEVVKLYAPDAVLRPTVSNNLRKNR